MTNPTTAVKAETIQEDETIETNNSTETAAKTHLTKAPA
jgi:hypothetical protein